MTSIKYAHFQVMATISGKFHKNPLKTVGGVAETRTSVDKMAKTDKGPVGLTLANSLGNQIRCEARNVSNAQADESLP